MTRSHASVRRARHDVLDRRPRRAGGRGSWSLPRAQHGARCAAPRRRRNAASSVARRLVSIATALGPAVSRASTDEKADVLGADDDGAPAGALAREVDELLEHAGGHHALGARAGHEARRARAFAEPVARTAARAARAAGAPGAVVSRAPRRPTRSPWVAVRSSMPAWPGELGQAGGVAGPEHDGAGRGCRTPMLGVAGMPPAPARAFDHHDLPPAPARRRAARGGRARQARRRRSRRRRRGVSAGRSSATAFPELAAASSRARRRGAAVEALAAAHQDPGAAAQAVEVGGRDRARSRRRGSRRGLRARRSRRSRRTRRRGGDLPRLGEGRGQPRRGWASDTAAIRGTFAQRLAGGVEGVAHPFAERERAGQAGGAHAADARRSSVRASAVSW